MRRRGREVDAVRGVRGLLEERGWREEFQDVNGNTLNRTRENERAMQ